MERARERLGETARRVNWIEADVTGDWHVPFVDVWHDRAVFHFLTNAEEAAMAPAPTMGWSTPATASGMATTL